MMYIDIEYVIGNALLKNIKNGIYSITLKQIKYFVREIQKNIDCVINESWKSIYSTVTTYPNIFKLNKEVIEISNPNDEIEEKLKLYFKEGLPENLITVMDEITLKQ